MDKYPVAIGLVLLLSGRVYAAPSVAEPLTVSLTGCPSAPVAVSEFVSAVQLELNLSQRPILSRSETPAAISVLLNCAGTASIRIRVGVADHTREVRVDDIPVAERPRVLALVVAELVRSGTQDAAAAQAQKDEHARAAPAESKKTNELPSASALDEAHESASTHASLESQLAVPRRSGVKPSIAAWIHLSSSAANAIYGGAVGIGWHHSVLRVELGFAHTERARGSITSGLAAARYRHSLQLTEIGKVGLQAALSSGAGVTWAVGESQVPGVVVRRVLFPYADARVELSLELWPAGRITPELTMYSGGALGLLSTDSGQGVLSSGGWLLGTGIGSTF